MKRRIIKVLVLMVVACSAVFVPAQAQSTQELIVDTWELDFDASVNAMPKDEKKVYNDHPSDARNHIKKFFKGKKYTFEENGTYEVSGGSKGSLSGTYSVSGNSLILKDGSSGRKITYKLVKLKKTQLILERLGSKNELIKRLYFKPQGN
ncbi:MAG: lipocalin family protein [Cyclobacteriaceae bacterium]